MADKAREIGAEQQRAHRVNLGSVASSIASETPMQVKKNPPVNEIVPDRNLFPAHAMLIPRTYLENFIQNQKNHSRKNETKTSDFIEN